MHATVCDIIADLVQNSIEAGASQVTSNPNLEKAQPCGSTSLQSTGIRRRWETSRRQS